MIISFTPKRSLARNQFCSKAQQWIFVSVWEQIASNALLPRVRPFLGIDLVVTPITPYLSPAGNRLLSSVKTSILSRLETHFAAMPPTANCLPPGTLSVPALHEKYLARNMFFYSNTSPTPCLRLGTDFLVLPYFTVHPV